MTEHEVNVNSYPAEIRKPFIVIDVPGADENTIWAIHAKAAQWLKDGGPLVLGGGSPDRPKATIALGYMDDLSGIVIIPQRSLPEHPTFAFQDATDSFSIYEQWNEYLYRLSAPSLQELCALYKIWKQQFKDTIHTGESK